MNLALSSGGDTTRLQTGDEIFYTQLSGFLQIKRNKVNLWFSACDSDHCFVTPGQLPIFLDGMQLGSGCVFTRVSHIDTGKLRWKVKC